MVQLNGRVVGTNRDSRGEVAKRVEMKEKVNLKRKKKNKSKVWEPDRQVTLSSKGGERKRERKSWREEEMNEMTRVTFTVLSSRILGIFFFFFSSWFFFLSISPGIFSLSLVSVLMYISLLLFRPLLQKALKKASNHLSVFLPFLPLSLSFSLHLFDCLPLHPCIHNAWKRINYVFLLFLPVVTKFIHSFSSFETLHNV